MSIKIRLRIIEVGIFFAVAFVSSGIVFAVCEYHDK